MLKQLQKWVDLHGPPKTLLTDQGRSYLGKEIKLFCTNNQVKHHTTTAYNPTGNSISERINPTVTRFLNTIGRFRINKLAGRISKVLQHQYHSAIGMSPVSLCGKPSMFDPLSKTSSNQLTQALNRSKIANERNFKRMNLNRQSYTYKIGERVYRRSTVKNKHASLWDGPCQITAINPDKNTIVIENPWRSIRTNIRHIRPA